jgi:hypothetical protein
MSAKSSDISGSSSTIRTERFIGASSAKVLSPNAAIAAGLLVRPKILMEGAALHMPAERQAGAQSRADSGAIDGEVVA